MRKPLRYSGEQGSRRIGKLVHERGSEIRNVYLPGGSGSRDESVEDGHDCLIRKMGLQGA
jgi:hypothetical protein